MLVIGFYVHLLDQPRSPDDECIIKERITVVKERIILKFNASSISIIEMIFSTYMYVKGIFLKNIEFHISDYHVHLK